MGATCSCMQDERATQLELQTAERRDSRAERVDDETLVESPRDVITFTKEIDIESLPIKTIDELTWQWSYQYQNRTLAFPDDVSALIEIHYQKCKLL